MLKLWLPKNRMIELVTSGSVGGMASNGRLYPEADAVQRWAFYRIQNSVRAACAAYLERYCDTMSHDLLLNSDLEVVDLAMVWCTCLRTEGALSATAGSQALGKRRGSEWHTVRFSENDRYGQRK